MRHGGAKLQECGEALQVISKLKTISILRAAISKWGEKAQMRMVSEECSELSAAVNQYERGRISKEEIASEIADVTIMVRQARMIIGNDLVDRQIDEKMMRLADTLNVDIIKSDLVDMSHDQALDRVVQLECALTSLQESTRSAIEKERTPRH